ncbi:phosphatidate cytidylyltransferase [Natronospira bacteriovora]|uniref:Phosphatidate cytidylyltransferase n=1 Tax=Natronospira bacteriovora TaxID=3069753 RepID=A0ABU0W5N0_9GAMM|nr:phosphatidate cytidylyltransferase [Natronospira sp. AB-CW4]MDQ2068340.1 phosphatidate cytidylyltransferase [Natronospira sp. AB-CW4]
MLKQRIITALILAPLAIAAIFLLSPLAFGLLLASVMAVAAWEWAGLSGVNRAPLRAVFAFAVFISCLPVAFLSPGWEWLLAVLPLWILAFFWLSRAHLQPPGAVRLIFGWGILLATCTAITLLQQSGPWYVILALALVAGADVGAYFAGKAFGRHRLAPSISPGKTWEGVAGGACLAILVAVAGAWFLDARSMWAFSLAGVIAAVLSVGGDLVESILKRQAGVKDSGRILPGHGGLLDRMDSLLVAAPILAIGLGLAGELA